MAKTRKNKSSDAASSSTEDNKSVRSKIVSIEGGLGNLTESLQKQNNNSISLINATHELLEVAYTYLRPMEDNIRVMTQAILGLDVTNGKGEKVDIKGMKIQGGGSADMKEQQAEAKKEDDQDDERQQRILDYTKLSAEQLKGLTGILKKGSFLDILILGGAVLAGFVTGLVEKIMGFFKPVVALLNKIRVLIFGEGTFLGKIIAGISKGFMGFIRVIKGISDFIYRFSGMQAIINAITSGIGKVVGFVISASKDFFKAIQTLGDFFNILFGKSKTTFGVFSKIFSYFDDIFKVIKPVFNIARAIGGTFLKFIPVLGVVMAIFDTVVGAFKGFTETEGGLVDKLIGGLKGGISGLLNGIFGSLFDLLKDGVSWVMSALGFDKAAAALDSFSFKDLISEAVNGIVEFFMTPVRIIQDIVKAMSGEMDFTDLFKSVMGRIVTALLTPLDFIGKRLGFSITDRALEMLGLPKAGAGDVSSTSSTGTPTKALEKTTDENLAAKDEAAAKSGGATAVVNTTNNPVINNNSQSTAILKSKTTNWEPDDQWARGGSMSWGA